MNYGFFRVAAAAPRLRVADPDYNAGQLETVIDRAVAQQVRLLVTPELSVTGYTCADLFFQTKLLTDAVAALARVIEASRGIHGCLYGGQGHCGADRRPGAL